ncbi:c-type cytochrome [Pseudomonas sp. Marseille-QA0332]
MNHTRNSLGLLAAMLASWVCSAHAALDEDIARRLEPVGQVCVQGQACKGVAATASAAGGAARSADEIVARHCVTCHGSGLLNAPKIGDTAAWKERADHQGGLDGILAKAITGINAMPAKGTCGDCSDEELKSAIKQMSGL